MIKNIAFDFGGVIFNLDYDGAVESFKRIGLAERTGRGVDRIFEGLLKYGRPAPDYSESNSAVVTVRMLSI